MNPIVFRQNVKNEKKTRENHDVFIFIFGTFDFFVRNCEQPKNCECKCACVCESHRQCNECIQNMFFPSLLSLGVFCSLQLLLNNTCFIHQRHCDEQTDYSRVLLANLIHFVCGKAMTYIFNRNLNKNSAKILNISIGLISNRIGYMFVMHIKCL